MAHGLFVEPFYGGSHKAFLDGLVNHSSHEIRTLTLSEGEWRRRMRRGAQELAELARNMHGDFDFLVASDMLDLPVFLALTRPRFDRVPVAMYFHENQMTYPRLKGTKFNSWFGAINYLSALAADAVRFNSGFHRDDFVGALHSLSGQTNNWLMPSSIAEIERKSGVLPVGVELDWIAALERARSDDAPRTILWNHRWEFDKAPELFARTLEGLAAKGVPFKLIVAGEPGDNPSEAITNLPQRFPQQMAHFGFAESREAYGELLWRSDIVVSTTRHEFFGIGTVEAMAAGCIPMAPNRYNYPTLVPEHLHDRLLWETEADLLLKLESLLTSQLPSRGQLREAAKRYAWPVVARQWDEFISQLTSGGFVRRHATIRSQ